MFLTHRDARDKREWSGTFYSMAGSLSRHSGEVVFAGPYYPKMIFFFLKAVNKISYLLLKKKYRITYSSLLSWAYNRHFARIIEKENPDIVFAPSSSGEISRLKTHKPLVFLGDATFNLLVDKYPNYSNLLTFSMREAHANENRAFKNADALVFSSEWAARSAVEDYNVPSEKVHIISYGANMGKVPPKEQVLKKNLHDPLHLLFLGVDWERKGGAKVFEAFKELMDMGINTRLTVCGCVPPERFRDPAMQIIPFLDKNNEKDADALYQLLLDANFLFIPSKADCTPIVFCEANAFGIPVITTDVGGIPSVISDGENGHIFPLETPAKKYAEKIARYHSNPNEYSKLVKSSWEYYEKNLNWDQWGLKMNEVFNKLIQDRENLKTR